MVTPEEKLKAAAKEYAENPKHYMPGFKPMGRVDNAFLAGARYQAQQADEERNMLREHKRLLFEENGRLLAEKESGQWDENCKLEEEREDYWRALQLIMDGGAPVGTLANVAERMLTMCEIARAALERWKK